MAGQWIRDHPIAKGLKCSCGAAATGEGLSKCWCDSCTIKSISILKEISDLECSTWTEPYAKDYLAQVTEKIAGRKRDVPAVEQDNGETIDIDGDVCAFCGVICGTDRLGRISSVAASKGAPVFHAKCRHKVVTWFKSDPKVQSAAELFKLNARQKWAIVVKRAHDVRDGKATLELETNDGTNARHDLADQLEGLSGLAGKGGSMQTGLEAFAKLVRGSEKGAKASPEDRREFGLDRHPWDLKDLAVEQAQRRGGQYADTHITNRKMEREDFMWWLVEGTSVDAASTASGRDMALQARDSGASRRFREGCMYSLFEGLTRRILAMDKDKILQLEGGEDLWKLTGLCKENARYAIQRIQWVVDGKHEWSNIEASECLQLEQDILRKHKVSKVLTRAKLQQLMRDKREEFLDALSTGSGGGASHGGSMTAAKAKRLRKQVTDMQAKLSKRNPGGLFTPTRKKGRGKTGAFDKFCEWCKRAERRSAMHSHDSKDCNKKPPGVK